MERQTGADRTSDERRCLVIDGQPTVRLGVGRLLAGRYEVEEAADGETALDLLTSLGDFEVAVVELGLAERGTRLKGIAAIRALRRAHPGLGIVAHGKRAERFEASEALGAGASAYVAKSSPVSSLSRAVEAAASAETFVDPAAGNGGGAALTRRQREILQQYADGRSTAEVARRLGLSVETVRTHTKGILARLRARDRTHAVAIGMRASLIQ